MAAPADKAEFRLPDAIFHHGIFSELLEVHIPVDGVDQFIIGADPAQNGLTVFVGALGDTLVVIQIRGNTEGIGQGFHLLHREDSQIFQKFTISLLHLLDAQCQFVGILDADALLWNEFCQIGLAELHLDDGTVLRSS